MTSLISTLENTTLNKNNHNNNNITTWSISNIYTTFDKQLKPGEIANAIKPIHMIGRITSKKILGKYLCFIHLCNNNIDTSDNSTINNKSIQLELHHKHFKDTFERMNIFRNILGKNDTIECTGLPAKTPSIGKMSFIIHSLNIIRIQQNLRGIERVLQGLETFDKQLPLLSEASLWLQCEEKDLAMLRKLQIEASSSSGDRKVFRKALRFVTNNLGMGRGPKQRSLADIGPFILEMKNRNKKKCKNNVNNNNNISRVRQKRVQEIVARRQAGLVVVLEDISNKLNAATILRSCDAYGVASVIFVFDKDKEPDWWLSSFHQQQQGNNNNNKLSTENETIITKDVLLINEPQQQHGNNNNTNNDRSSSNMLFKSNHHVCDWREWGSWGLNTSVSAIKWVQMYSFSSTKECLSELRKQDFISVSTRPPAPGTVSIDEAQFITNDDIKNDDGKIKKLAIWFGSEHSGLSQTAIIGANIQMHVPMMGMIESLNLSVSVGTILFEITRQRREHSKKKLGLGNDDDGIGIPGYTLPVEEQIELVNALCSSAF